MLAVTLLIVHFGVYDLSLEYDLKNEQHQNLTKEECQEEGQEDKEDTISVDKSDLDDEESDSRTPILGAESERAKEGAFHILRILVSDVDVVLIFLWTFVLYFVLCLLNMWFSLLMVEVMHWGISIMNICYLVDGVVGVGMLLVFWWKPIKGENKIYVALTGFIAMSLTPAFVILIVNFHTNVALSVFLWTAVMFMMVYSTMIERIFLVSAMAEKVPSAIQSFAESCRTMFNLLASMLSILFSGYLFSHVELVCALMICATVSSTLALFVRIKYFANPNQVKI